MTHSPAEEPDDADELAMNRRSLLRRTGAGTLALVGFASATGTATAHTLEADFKGCSEVWLLVVDPGEWEEPEVREGVLCASVCYYDESAGSVATEEVCFSREDVTTIPGQHGDTELYKYRPPDEEDKVLAVNSHRGDVLCNDHRCAQNVENTCFDGECESESTGPRDPPRGRSRSRSRARD